MKTIHKYPLTLTDEQSLSMPQGARPLSVQVQRGVPCLWAIVDPSEDIRPIRVRMVGTGHPMEEDGINWRFVGTIQLHDGALVFHFFYEPSVHLAGTD